MNADEFLPGTENMKCAMGLYRGSRKWVDGPFKGHHAHGVFSKVDISDEPCTHPVRVWCKWKDGTYAWLACGNPEHQCDAEVVLSLEGEKGAEYIAFLIWQQNPFQSMPEILKNRQKRNPFLDKPTRIVEVQAVKEPALLPAPGQLHTEYHASTPKPRIPRNKGNKSKRRIQQILDTNSRYGKDKR